MRYVAVCPHSAGIFQAQEVEIEAESLADAHALACIRIIGGRYVARIYEWTVNGWVEVWHAGMPLQEGTDNGT
jgi:hypothetical protein